MFNESLSFFYQNKKIAKASKQLKQKDKEEKIEDLLDSKFDIEGIEKDQTKPNEIIVIDLEEPVKKEYTEKETKQQNSNKAEEGGVQELDPELKALIQSNKLHEKSLSGDENETIEAKFRLESSEKLQKFHFNEIIIKCYKSSNFGDLLPILGTILNLEPSKLVLTVNSILIYPSTSLNTIKKGTFIDIFADKNDFTMFSCAKEDNSKSLIQEVATEISNTHTFNVKISPKECVSVKISPCETLEALLHLIRAKSNNYRLNSLFFDGEELDLKRTIMNETEIEDGDMLEARIKE